MNSSAFNGIDWQPVWLSLQVGGAATLIAVAAGAPLGWWLTHTRVIGRRFLNAFVLLPLVLPPTVLGYYLLVLIGQRGPIGVVWQAVFGAPLVFTSKAAVLAACASTIPIVTRQLAAAFTAIDPDVTEAARLDGATGLSLFFQVHLPQIREPLIAAATIAFARAVGDFGATLMVAGNIPGRTQTASIAIYDLMNAGRDAQALVLVVIVSLVSLIVLVLTSGRQRTEM